MARRNGGGLLTFSGMLAGAAIGAALGLVFSPATGEENRRRIAEWARARLDQTRERAYEQVEQAFSTVRTGVQGVAVQAQERAEAIKSEAEARIEQVREEVQNATSGAQAGVRAATAAGEEA